MADYWRVARASTGAKRQARTPGHGKAPGSVDRWHLLGHHDAADRHDQRHRGIGLLLQPGFGRAGDDVAHRHVAQRLEDGRMAQGVSITWPA
jgi:hypothetical protein